jgi:hypothetical protein
MDSGVLIKDLCVGGAGVDGHQVVYKDKHDNIRIYALCKKNDVRLVVLSFNSCPIDEKQWEIGSTTVDVLMHCQAFYDGVRHMFFSPDDGGYLYYPDTIVFSEIFKKINEIELEYCSHKEQDNG